MTPNSYEIRICDNCGLRYPLTHGHPFGARCPACAGETRVFLSRPLILEPDPDRSSSRPASPRGKREEIAVLLDNVRSAWNAGSILRSADGFGFDHAYLCGITPTPENEAVTKTSLGAEDAVTWSYHKDAVRLVKGLKKEGWGMFALEEDTRAVSISGASTFTSSRSVSAHASTSLHPAQRGALIVGNEVTGVDPELLDLCDAIFFIPMRGKKKSFNVAIAFSIAAYALR